MEGDPEGYDIRYTEATDAKALKEWLSEPNILKWFPVIDEPEIDDAVARWISFSRFRCSLTAMDCKQDNKPVGIITLYLQPYKKLSHQCEFGIIVDQNYRGQKIGTMLLNNAMHLAKERFKIELLHLQVYDGNPAYRLYERLGFKEFGRQSHWIKENGEPLARIFMERFL